MNTKTIILTIISSIWWLIPILIIGIIAKTNWFKGMIGELIVNMSARLLLNAKDYIIINDVTLPIENGTTQIDHIIVSKFGIFVIETKNFSGWIFGKKDDPTWTQKIYKTTNKFQNPLRQNYRHTKTLEELLGIPKEKIFSVIVFVGNSKFKTEMPENVTYAGGYIKYIKSKTTQIFTDKEINEIVQKITDKRLLPSLSTTRTHIKNLENRHQVNSIKNKN